MRPSLLARCICPFLLCVLPLAVAQVVNIPTYFIITYPTKGSVWSNNATNSITWTAAVNEVPNGVFDVELARLSTDGLLFVALNVEISWNGLNVEVDGVPDGDDYFLLFLDAQHGISYSTSQRFAIEASNGTTPSTLGNVPTATVAGSPNPIATFGTTFAPVVLSAAVGMSKPVGVVILAVMLSLGTWMAL